MPLPVLAEIPLSEGSRLADHIAAEHPLIMDAARTLDVSALRLHKIGGNRMLFTLATDKPIPSQFSQAFDRHVDTPELCIVINWRPLGHDEWFAEVINQSEDEANDTE